jgi:hypothetical protein
VSAALTIKSEAKFTSWVLKSARERGWLAAHLSNHKIVRRPDGPVAVADRNSAGFPDVVLVHETYGTHFAELKMPTGRLRPEQIEWLRRLRASGQNVYVFWPKDVDAIVELLESGSTPQLSLELLARKAKS